MWSLLCWVLFSLPQFLSFPLWNTRRKKNPPELAKWRKRRAEFSIFGFATSFTAPMFYSLRTWFWAGGQNCYTCWIQKRELVEHWERRPSSQDRAVSLPQEKQSNWRAAFLGQKGQVRKLLKEPETGCCCCFEFFSGLWGVFHYSFKLRIPSGVVNLGKELLERVKKRPMEIQSMASAFPRQNTAAYLSWQKGRMVPCLWEMTYKGGEGE